MNRLYLIAALIIALCISLGINFAQYRSDLIEDTEAPLQARITTYEVTERINTEVSKARAADGRELERLRSELAKRQVVTVDRWRERIVKLPPPTCSPGHERVAAWNALATGEIP